MHIARLQAEALTWASLEQLDAEPAQRERAVSSAKVMAARACRVVGQGAVQIHGGMGMTEELAVGHYFRRATMIEAQLGSVDWHLRRVERHGDARATAS
jgi:alkylation response protein AidB-like acyl-CoA dehydrogenase